MKTIKSRFNFTVIVITFFLLALGLFTNQYIRRNHQNNILLQQVEQLRLIKERMETTEKNFMLNESVNAEFFETGESKFINIMDSLQAEKNIIINNISGNRVIGRLHRTEEVMEIDKKFDELAILFDNLTNALYQHGYRGYGLSGQMRTHIHRVENILEQDDSYELKVMMLMLRRFEKNFMLRKDPQYIDRFDQMIEDFKGRILQLNVHRELIPILDDYRATFVALAQKNMEIGTITDRGLVHEIYNKFNSIDPLIAGIHATISAYSARQVKTYNTALVIAFLSLSFSIIFVYSLLSHRIVSQLMTLSRYIDKLGRGLLPEKIITKGTDEIAKMIDSINILTDNLKNTRTFALEVGKGNFTTDINVFGNSGDLGGSLIQMKYQLEEVARQRLEQNEAETKRIWSSEGLALFGQILRQNGNDMEKMTDMLAKNIVKYLDANQAGIFLWHENGGEQYFELVACYAYDRKKFFSKRVFWGEGLIGACAQEKDSIYLTELPKDYITITSGLGNATPDYIYILPLINEDKVLGVLEVAGFDKLENYKREFLQSLSNAIASHIHILKSNIYNAELLKMSEELTLNLRQQEEELKQTIEEMQAAREDSDRTIESLRRELEDNKDFLALSVNGVHKNWKPEEIAANKS